MWPVSESLQRGKTIDNKLCRMLIRSVGAKGAVFFNQCTLFYPILDRLSLGVATAPKHSWGFAGSAFALLERDGRLLH